MKIAIYGLGAVGGLLAARLASAGFGVSAIARGQTLDVLREGPLTLVETVDGVATRSSYRIAVSSDPAALGVQDVLILAPKTTGLLDMARKAAPLIGKDTLILSVMNGIQWWFPAGLDQPWSGMALQSVDPGGVISAAFPSASVVGAVTHLSASVLEPGTVRRNAGNAIILGEAALRQVTPRVESIASALSAAGLAVELSDHIQRDVWYKLWGNMTINPISALTRATGDLILADPRTRAFATRCMLEAAEIGGRIGLHIDEDPEQRHHVTEKLGAFRTSMLQDVEAGKALEIDAILSAVSEIAAQVGVDCPDISALHGLASVLARATQVRRA